MSQSDRFLIATIFLILILFVMEEFRNENLQRDPYDFYFQSTLKKIIKSFDATFLNDCHQPRNGEDIVPSEFVLAILATENFARPKHLQYIEYIWAYIYRLCFGRLPSITIGPSQINVNLAYNIAYETFPDLAILSDYNLLRLLRNQCFAFRIAKYYLNSIALQCKLKDFNISSAYHLAATYNGQKTRSKNNRLYLVLVWEAYNFYASKNKSKR